MVTDEIESASLEENEDIQMQRNEFNIGGEEQKKAYCCTYPECKNTFVKPKLEKHLCVHTEERPFVCDFEDCGKAFTNFSCLKRHKISHNEVKEVFPCKSCELTFTNAQNLKRHCKRLHDNPLRLYFPKICEVFIEQPEDIIQRKRNEFKTLTGQQRRTYCCTYPGCKAIFIRPSKLKRHLCMHTGERPFVCDFEDCDKAYTNFSYLKRHKITHNEVKEIFPCKICEMTFTRPHNLKRHCKRIHDNPLRLYHLPKICEECQAEFPTRKLLKTHVSEIHERKLYKCEYCPKSFAEPSILQRHLNSSVHKTYHCKICSTFFNKYQELKNHDKQEHLVSYTEYTCDHCGKKFSCKRSMRLHVRDHMIANVIMCSYEGCNRIYYFQRNLDQHIRTFHLGEKWKCPSCPAQLSTKQKLKAHIQKIHENPMPRKPPPTKENRKRRWDAGKPKKSAVSELVGLLLPKEAEKDLIYRHVIKLEPS